MKITKETISAEFKKIQDHICQALENADGGSSFIEDVWDRPEGGGGRTRILQNGKVIEKGGVAFSAVEGPTPAKILTKLQLDQADFYATGVSIVIHPKNPMVPIIHMNIRYFEMSNGVNWFGGGIDLTPHYVLLEDAKYFHKEVKQVCDDHDSSFYPKFKKWADDYFYIRHRKETRGVGGIFFDRLTSEKEDEFANLFSFVKSIGYLFPKVYTHFMHKNHELPYGEHEKKWQALRRGRYVEFNLVWDAGTKFGLDTNGRTESILMSMPPDANWHYMHQVAEGTPEHETLNYLKKDIDWLNL